MERSAHRRGAFSGDIAHRVPLAYDGGEGRYPGGAGEERRVGRYKEQSSPTLMTFQIAPATNATAKGTAIRTPARASGQRGGRREAVGLRRALPGASAAWGAKGA